MKKVNLYSIVIIFLYLCLFLGGCQSKTEKNKKFRMLVENYITDVSSTISNRMRSSLTLDEHFINTKVKFLVTISKQGGIQQIELKESSNNPHIDDTFKEFIVNSNPFPSLPKGIDRESLQLDISFGCNLFGESKLKCGVEVLLPCRKTVTEEKILDIKLPF